MKLMLLGIAKADPVLLDKSPTKLLAISQHTPVLLLLPLPLLSSQHGHPRRLTVVDGI